VTDHQVTETSVAPASPAEATFDIAGAASLIALGNVASRVLGLARETVIAYLFGATGMVSAFEVASRVPRMLFDLLIDGLVSSALVPVFSELAERDRAELWRVASIMLSLTAVVMSVALLVMELFASQIAWLMSGGFEPRLLSHTAYLVRLTSPAVIFLSLSGITTGLLYALKRFTLPAFTVTVFNASLVVVALVLTGWLGWGIESLAVGMLVGSAMQVALQLPGLRGARLRFELNWRRPGLRRILRLYAPVVLGLIVSQIGIVIDRNLASRTGEQSIAWMRYATTLVQFPLGLVSAAIAMAILPTLSRLAAPRQLASQEFTRTPVRRECTKMPKPLPLDLQSSGVAATAADCSSAASIGRSRLPQENIDVFMDTLARGLRMVLVLILPAVMGLFTLSQPVVALVFQHGDFTAFDTQQTALALRIYLLGTAFAAVDLPLVFAFYARQDTLTPALVGVLGVGVYLAAALVPTAFRELRMTDLVLANSIQLTAHALVMLRLTHRLGSLRQRGLGGTVLKVLLASLIMAGLAALVAGWLAARLPGGPLWRQALIVGGAALVGGIVYGLLTALLRVEEVATLLGLLRRPLVRFTRRNQAR
jgi:putative peptidoglycan lipid II flippase